MAVSVVGRKPRSAAPTDQTAGQVVSCLESWFKARQTRDICGLLEEWEKSVNWKTQPVASLLAALSDLLGLTNNFRIATIGLFIMNYSRCV